MKKSTRISLAILLAAIFLACGFLRDYVFLNVNEQTRVAYYHSTDSSLSPSLHFLTRFSYMQLYYAKWMFTFFFSFLFMVLTLAFVKLFFREKKFLRWTVFAYGGLILLAGLFFLGGYLADNSEKGYLIARFLMGMAQGPVVLMVLIPSFKLMALQRR
jgi:hypothetical protein